MGTYGDSKGGGGMINKLFQNWPPMMICYEGIWQRLAHMLLHPL